MHRPPRATAFALRQSQRLALAVNRSIEPAEVDMFSNDEVLALIGGII